MNIRKLILAIMAAAITQASAGNFADIVQTGSANVAVIAQGL